MTNRSSWKGYRGASRGKSGIVRSRQRRTTGWKGKKIIEEIHPDIVFMDICMPEMDGLAMIAAIHSQFPDLEVCVLTGYRDFEYAKEAIRLGVTRFLLKPSNMDELEEAIGKMCGNPKRKGITGDAPKRDPQDEEAAEAHKESASSSFIVKNARLTLRRIIRRS